MPFGCPVCGQSHPNPCGNLLYCEIYCPVCNCGRVSPAVSIPCRHGLCRGWHQLLILQSKMRFWWILLTFSKLKHNTSSKSQKDNRFWHNLCRISGGFQLHWIIFCSSRLSVNFRQNQPQLQRYLEETSTPLETSEIVSALAKIFWALEMYLESLLFLFVLHRLSVSACLG